MTHDTERIKLAAGVHGALGCGEELSDADLASYQAFAVANWDRLLRNVELDKADEDHFDLLFRAWKAERDGDV